MTVKQVIKKYQKRVPFPISPEKISAAGLDPDKYLRGLCRELTLCSDLGENHTELIRAMGISN